MIVKVLQRSKWPNRPPMTGTMGTLELNQPTPNHAHYWYRHALGFRPFFLLATVAAVILMTVWLLVWHNPPSAIAYYQPVGWHSHEMLFGYAAAVIAGFLLTAVRNWTGQDTPTGAPLAALTLIWLAGRLLPWMHAPNALIAGIDLAFLPLLALSLVRPLWRGQNRANRLFVPLLLIMAVANGLVHAQALGLGEETAAGGTQLMLHAVLLILVLVGGRVMPFFTRNVIPGWQPTTRPWVETLGIVLLISLGIARAFGDWPILGWAYLALAAVQGLRVAGWYSAKIWRIPLLWVLHVGYFWLVIGMALTGLAHLGAFMTTAATHALTAGAIGVLTLGMMARVALGHSGRRLEVHESITLAFAALQIGVAMRVFGPAWWPEHYLIWIGMSGLIWVIAFATYVVVYLPVLGRPRVDGKAG